MEVQAPRDIKGDLLDNELKKQKDTLANLF